MGQEKQEEVMTKEEKKAYDAARYAANPEKEKARSAAYRAANPEQVNTAARAWQAANPGKSAEYYAVNREKRLVYQAEYHAGNAEGISVKKAVYYAANREEILAQRPGYQSENEEKIRAQKRIKKYGLSSGAYQLMLLMQKNACGICKEVFSDTPHVDHCHKTGEVRGLLCSRCNKALGGFRDSLEILEGAKQYMLGR